MVFNCQLYVLVRIFQSAGRWLPRVEQVEAFGSALAMMNYIRMELQPK